jgi:hypothetical protein
MQQKLFSKARPRALAGLGLLALAAALPLRAQTPPEASPGGPQAPRRPRAWTPTTASRPTT